jgi:hypothetical protein
MKKKKHTNIRFFFRCERLVITSPKFSMLVYQLRFMEPNSIQLISDTTRSAWVNERQSQICIKYLSWLSHRDNVRIDMGTNSLREPRVTASNIRVDGLITETNTVIEVNGCSNECIFLRTISVIFKKKCAHKHYSLYIE